LSVVALVTHGNHTVIVKRLAEDIWLLDDGSIVSFLDIFIHASQEAPVIKSLKLVTLGRIGHIAE